MPATNISRSVGLYETSKAVAARASVPDIDLVAVRQVVFAVQRVVEGECIAEGAFVGQPCLREGRTRLQRRCSQRQAEQGSE